MVGSRAERRENSSSDVIRNLRRLWLRSKHMFKIHLSWLTVEKLGLGSLASIIAKRLKNSSVISEDIGEDRDVEEATKQHFADDRVNKLREDELAWWIAKELCVA